MATTSDLHVVETRPLVAPALLHQDLAPDSSALNTVTSARKRIKAIVVDDTRLYLGSANLSKNAITASAEWGIICESPDIIQRLRAYLDHLIERGRLKEVEVDVR